MNAGLAEIHLRFYAPRFVDRRTGLVERLRDGADTPLFAMFCQASVTASPSVSSRTEANHTLVAPARPQAPLSGVNVSG